MTSNYVRLKYETKPHAAGTELQETKGKTRGDAVDVHVGDVKVEQQKPGNPFD
jgi:hypothetical protein